jgi:DNA-binding phage protein
MPGLRRPPDTSGPAHDLQVALRRLYLVAGAPSVRDIAKKTGALSRDTVHRVLTRPGLPRWGTLELIVEALGGDIETFRILWIAARRAMDGDLD